MAKKKRSKSERQKAKEFTWKWCSKYVRLRDCINKVEGWGKCCSCGKIVFRDKADAGHFLSRKMGGSSGVYFDERNIHLQCKTCNAFIQGNYAGYLEFMLNKYGQEVIDELEIKDKTNSYTLTQILILGVYYKETYEALCRKHGIK